ncbi:unnamed protein product [Orchesella dallaii]|uniref:C2H2-type domain-containing protein n=1 Tax=Orchesella dallaii TaxID=48710 RepID=A0ABP1RUH4_9HEXA
MNISDALNSNEEYSEVNLADYLIQDWNIYEKNKRGGLKDTSNVPVTTFSSDKHDEGGYIHKKRKKRSRSRSSSLTKNAKENRELEKKRLKDSKPWRFLPVDDDDGNYECDMCVYKTDDASDFTFHIEALHEANCGMFRCPNCFAFLSPSEKESHRNLCQPHLARHPGTEKKLGEELTKGETRNLNLSKPYYISFRRGKFNGWQYQCRNCPYETLHLSSIQAHIQIHGEIFSGEAIACETCGWHMLPKYLDAHQILNHPGEEYESDSPAQNSGSNEGVLKNRKKLKCFKCPYKTSKRIRLEAHLEIHVEGSQAAPCKGCGWYLLPNVVNRHRNYCHGQGVH